MLGRRVGPTMGRRSGVYVIGPFTTLWIEMLKFSSRSSMSTSDKMIGMVTILRGGGTPGFCPTIAGFNLNLCLLEAREGVHGGFEVRSQTVEVSRVQFLNKFDLGTIPENI